MLPVPDTFLEALTGSTEHALTVDLWSGDNLTPSLRITGGEITARAGDLGGRTLRATIADPDGALVPRSDAAPLTPFGPELHVRSGLTVAGVPMLASLGWMVVTSVDVVEQTQAYARVDGMKWVSRGASIAVTGRDRALLVDQARFLSPEQPAPGATIHGEIARLLRGLVPVRIDPAVQNRAVPRSVVYRESRLQAVAALADAAGAIAVVDADGDMTIRPRVPSTSPVWEVTGGTGALTIDAALTLSREGIYNAVVARGQTSSGAPVQALVTENGGALRWDGPMKRIPYFFESPLIETQAAAAASARTTLNRLVQARTQVLSVRCASNPALELGDTVTLPLPGGAVDGVVVGARWPLTPGQMLLDVEVPRASAWAVWGQTL